MPPKAKFTKPQITAAALELIRQEGTDALTARALARQLGSSACPIFTAFENMEDVQSAAIQAARELYGAYIQKGLQDTPAFRGVGMQYIRFAIEEPQLFQLLFMSEQPQKPAISNVLPLIDANYPQILQSVIGSYQLSEADAARFYQHLWIYSHGIAVLCATNLCLFTLEEIGGMLAEVSQSLLARIKGGNKA